MKLAKDTMFEKELTERLERYRKAVGSGSHFGIPAAAINSVSVGISAFGGIVAKPLQNLLPILSSKSPH